MMSSEKAVAVVCVLIEMAVRKVSVTYIVVVTVKYKLIFSLLSLFVFSSFIGCGFNKILKM